MLYNMLERFPLFSKHIKSINAEGYVFLFIYHLLDNNEPFLEYWVRHLKTLGIISIPYSEVPAVRENLAKLTRIVSPKDVSEIPDILVDIVQSWPQKNIILVEVGGYSSFVSHKLHNIVLVAEDTNQGHWNHLLSKNPRTYPVVSIAQTEVKKLENRVVGESIVKAVEAILKDALPAKDLRHLQVGVVAYGGIGSSVCLALRKRHIQPLVYDKNPKMHAFAHADGYTIARKAKLLHRSDVVIACSGQSSVGLQDAHDIKDGALLCSGSSKRIEFQELLQMEKADTAAPGLLQDYKNHDKTFTIAYDGQPVNFLDVVHPEEFDYVLAANVASVKYGLENQLAHEVHHLPDEHQEPLFRMLVDKIIAQTTY